MQQIAHDGDQGEQDQEAQHFQRRAATIAERSMSLLSNDFVTASNDDFTPEDLLLEVTAQVLDTPFASDTFTTATGALDGVSTSSVEAAAADVLGRATTSSSDYTDNDSERGSKKRSSSSLDASMGTATDPNSHTATHSHTPKSKTRKPRYLVQKEEKAALMKEVTALESRVDFLSERSGISDRKLESKVLENATLREAVRDQHLSFATAQSVVAGFLNAGQSNPLTDTIRLGFDWDERHEVLLALKDRKFRKAHEYILARSQFLDPLKPHASDDRFENAQGDYCCVRHDLNQFENVQSVRQVYDALLNYLLNMEINISERLGHITVREDYDCVEETISNYRLLSTENGVPVESNCVLYYKYFEADELLNGTPCGVVTVDCVDDDALYPYAPSERVRKDIAAAILLTPHMRKKSNGEEGEELVVTMSRGGFLKLHHAEFEVPSDAVQELKEEITGWGYVMMKTMRETLKNQTR